MKTRGVVRPLAAADLPLVRGWRNHPDVRAVMFTTHEISADEHERWFAAASADPARHLLVYEADGVPTGFASLVRLRGSDVADWGFYLAPDAPRGSGAALGAAVLDHAFGPLALHKVCGQALASNAASIRLHDKLGFRREGQLREQHADGTRHHDVVVFGLLRAEWVARRQAGAD